MSVPGRAGAVTTQAYAGLEPSGIQLISIQKTLPFNDPRNPLSYSVTRGSLRLESVDLLLRPPKQGDTTFGTRICEQETQKKTKD
ncbi:unnamed protein product [Clonostachys rosea]|uniref:Uncharacterized protein n=1 Tax=Bionectria ochroleuca TaxID=29856 RepID=A0ABY6V0A0_BIOOC|nr:unnamed protein product [Clonostachys rosea]